MDLKTKNTNTSNSSAELTVNRINTFLNTNQANRPEGCEICYESFTSITERNPVNQNVINIVLRALFEIEDEQLSNIRQLFMCQKCIDSWNLLKEAVLEIHALKLKFVKLGKQIGKQFILGSLGMLEGDWKKWERSMGKFYYIYPSLMSNQMNLNKEEDHIRKNSVADIKLTKMNPVVLIKRLHPHSANVNMENNISVLSKTRLSADENNSSETITTPATSGIKIETEIASGTIDELENECWYIEDVKAEEEEMETVAETTSKNQVQEEEDNKIHSLKSRSDKRSARCVPSSDRQLRKRPALSVVSTELNSESDEDLNSNAEISSSPEPNCSTIMRQKKSSKNHGRVVSKSAKLLRRKIGRLRKLDLEKRDNNIGKGTIKCSMCKETFKSKYNLAFHMKKVHHEFNCAWCGFHSKCETEFNEHKKNMHSKGPTGKQIRVFSKCPECSVMLISPNYRIQHMANVHGIIIGEQKFNCTHCELSFNMERLLWIHKMQAHNVGSTEQRHYQCDLCLKFFLYKLRLHNHKRAFHYGGREAAENDETPENIGCFICLEFKSCSSSVELKLHEASAEHEAQVLSRALVYCNVCRTNFKGDVEALRIHLQGEDHRKELDGLGSYDRTKFCVPCRETFNSIQDLKKHEWHDNSHKEFCRKFRDPKSASFMSTDNSFICHACPSMFETQKTLDGHITSFHSTAGYYCKVCKKKFTNQVELLIHRRTHRYESKKNFICDKCGKTLRNRETMRRHNINVHSGRQFKCEECDDMFKTLKGLQSHERIVHDKGTAKIQSILRKSCPYCDSYGTRDATLMRKHLYKKHPDIYLKEKSYCCSVCFDTFLSQQELQCHMERHADLICYFCNKYSQDKPHLDVHIRVHTGERPFKCSYCHCEFKTYGNISNHVKALHTNAEN